MRSLKYGFLLPSCFDFDLQQLFLKILSLDFKFSQLIFQILFLLPQGFIFLGQLMSLLFKSG